MGDCRRVGVAVDFSACSKKAVKWAIDNVVQKGDHLILINIQPETNHEKGELLLWVTTGSPLIPLNGLLDPLIMKKYGVNPDPETLDLINTAANQKEITVLMKIFWGDARERLCESVDSIPLDFLIIGNRGLSKLQRVIMGSVSNYVVNHAPCPVTVVKSMD